MEFDFLTSVGTLVLLSAIGTFGLAASGVMTANTIFMMVLPSMIGYAVVAYFLGMKFGEYQAAR